ncbi:MAG: transglutaminase-like domain-containing protein, partial [Dehalococcoidia bacterium]
WATWRTILSCAATRTGSPPRPCGEPMAIRVAVCYVERRGILVTHNLWREFLEIARLPDEEIVLARAALLLAATEDPALDIDRQLGYLDSLAAGASTRLGDQRDPLFAVNTLSDYLFDEVGFRGNEEDYYDPRNSFLNEVLKRRLGIPITLALVYIETGRRLGIPLMGVGLPGHFLVRHRDIDDLVVDPFHNGILLSEAECAEQFRQATGEGSPWRRRYLAPIGNREYIARMVRNLKGAYLRRRDYPRAMHMFDWLLHLEPPPPLEQRERGVVHLRMGEYREALEDLRAYLVAEPDSPEAEAVQDLIDRVRRRLAE